MWRAAPSAIETGQNSTVTGPQALTRYEYQSVVPLFPSCSMGERPTAQEAKTETGLRFFFAETQKVRTSSGPVVGLQGVICARTTAFSRKREGNGSLDRCRNIEAFDSEPKAWFYQEAQTDRNTFAVISLWGKFGGLPACGGTFLYIVPLPNILPTRLFSKTRLKRKDSREILRLPWAQEVPSSNLGAPTKTSRVLGVERTNPW